MGQTPSDTLIVFYRILPFNHDSSPHDVTVHGFLHFRRNFVPLPVSDLLRLTRTTVLGSNSTFLEIPIRPLVGLSFPLSISLSKLAESLMDSLGLVL